MILVCGEAIVDLFLYERRGTRIAAQAVAGGSPFNVAIGLARLGSAVSFCGGLSTDSLGDFLSSLLEREGVDLAHVLRTSRLTTISVVATDEQGQARYSFHGEGAADRSLTPEDLDFDLPPAVEALTFGSYTLAVEPVASAFLSLARREASRRLISIDPNIRPTVIGDLSTYDRHLQKFLKTAAIVKASEEDIGLIYGLGADAAQIASDWLKLGPALVVLTRGHKGAIAFRKNGAVELPGRNVDVVDTVGAGDSFHAALLASLLAGGNLAREALENLSTRDLEGALAYAITASSITCGRRGADLPTRAEIEGALPRR